MQLFAARRPSSRPRSRTAHRRCRCQVDTIAAHIYDSATNVAYYQKYIADLGTRYNRSMVPFLDNLDSVLRYAWFMTAVDNLVNSDASLSALGETYVS
ncbi:glycoside hydrolase family 128 protein [Trametes coccinea BRFM310]|uniref:Glycoside hydrolase family 128 protein n=1 Tax=Trametes coccinea (strain BRFM310) TaxID=1353009 RepID=A0A1Y2IPV2_TRAC3|nr:glycoside hydrolase family 128 protein [Trametes coccinea BRFM310]